MTDQHLESRTSPEEEVSHGVEESVEHRVEESVEEVVIPIDRVLAEKLEELSIRIGHREIRRPDQILRSLLRVAEQEYSREVEAARVKVAYDGRWYSVAEGVWERLSSGGVRPLDWGESLKQLRELRKDDAYVRAQEELLGYGDQVVGQQRFAKILEMYEQAALKGLELEQELREQFEHLGLAVSRGGLGGALGYSVGLGLIEIHQHLHGRGQYLEQQRQRYKQYREEVLQRWGEGQAFESGQQLRATLDKVHDEVAVESAQHGADHQARVGEPQSMGTGFESGKEGVNSLNTLLGDQQLLTPSTSEKGVTEQGRVRIRQRDRTTG